ncbi:PP2C family protein-serine/threonine phosphatase [Streptomyces sp. SL13]|uniref:PP2C family protein-serine/threonine phosphatase n=1 Tax=Streptantibioticus silvisoli TaxID=2705255 RepID=A0AA90KAQ8_9ACTN|nr:PP2C family protein-serine/threonine phosphatase [Streptantibioticus silvisoli]MDI5961786.1 PP2C family protein-serine/threonine phosphatase [Streptantibioticus silvisoli]MDI5972402.1 PP2C family protein-serine/threonine phosphatase [Streptantibioticus silvisoli]
MRTEPPGRVLRRARRRTRDAVGAGGSARPAGERVIPGVGRAGNRRLRALPAVLLVCGLVLDLFTPPDLSAAPFYSAAPMVASTLLTLRATVLTGVLACAADVLVDARYGTLSGGGGQTEVVTIATVSGIAVLINRLLKRTDLRLESVRGIALAVQRAVLPQPPGRIGSTDVAARYEAAQSDARLGGDLYAVQDTAYGLRCIVGDVRGKGLGAVEAVAVVLGAFREAAELEPTLGGVTGRVERALDREGLRRASLDRFEGFTTAVLAEIPPGGGEVRVINRGHPLPLLLMPDGTVRQVTPGETAVPLGMESLLPPRNTADHVPFPDGTTLLLHTDGLTEARDRAGVFFEPVAAMSGRVFAGPEDLLDALLADVDRHTGGARDDDLAMIALTRRPR